VKLIQKIGKKGLVPSYIADADSDVTVVPTKVKHEPTCGVQLKSYKQPYYGRDVSVLELDGKLTDINDYKLIDKLFSESAIKTPGELSAELIKVGPNSPGSMDGTGLFQTLTSLKLREFYELSTGKKVKT
jgi:phosphoribulokinase